jgi:hypothetical protein
MDVLLIFPFSVLHNIKVTYASSMFQQLCSDHNFIELALSVILILNQLSQKEIEGQPETEVFIHLVFSFSRKKLLQLNIQIILFGCQVKF